MTFYNDKLLWLKSQHTAESNRIYLRLINQLPAP